MNKKSILILILPFCFFVKVMSQKCPPAFDKGTMYNVIEKLSNNLCFKWEPVPEADKNVYHTKYIITSGNGKEMYNIHFYFYQSIDSIVLVYLNTATGKTASKSIAFDEHSSIRMIKNYEINDTSINKNTQLCTLFTIPDITRPYIVLNQFQLIDDKDTYLSLEPINPEKLQQHLKEAEIYNRWKDSTSIIIEKENVRIANRKKEISAFLNSMFEYKEKEIQKIMNEDNDYKIYGQAIEVSSGTLNDFKIKLDLFFTDYFKNVFPFENFNSEIKFMFICKADGKIDESKTILQSDNSMQMKWFEDSFNVNIMPSIKAPFYKLFTTIRYNLNLITDFNTKFSESFNWLKPDNDEFKEFLDTKKKIYNEFEKYLSREIYTPTKYTYSLKYKSTVEFAEWIYEINRKGIEKIDQKGSILPIPENLKNIFKNKIAKPNIGKYRIKICNVYINDKLIGQDIQPVSN